MSGSPKDDDATLPRVDPTAEGKPQPSRTATRSVPPPIPSRTRTGGQNAQLATCKPDSPSVVDRAIATQVDAREHAARRAKELAHAASPSLLYELGELHEQRGELADAVAAYRKALELDKTLAPAVWGLRRIYQRENRAAELGVLIEREADVETDADRRVDLLLERALVLGSEHTARPWLDRAAKLSPKHPGVLLELERVLARTDLVGLIDVLEHHAESAERPRWQVAYWIDVARVAAMRDHARARKAFTAAYKLAAAPVTERIAREQLRLADEFGAAGDIEAGLEALAGVLAETERDASPTRAAVRKRELIAVRRRQAQLSPPDRAWAGLLQALALAPDEPLLLVALLTRARELGRYDEVPRLLRAWHAAETDADRQAMISWWCSDALTRGDRPWSRALLASLEQLVPGFVLAVGVAECDALADGSTRDLANTYLMAAAAAHTGTWTGPAQDELVDRSAASALFVQAAELLAYIDGSPDGIAQARAALDAAPDTPASIEAAIEFADATGRPEVALDLLRRNGTDRASVERAIRIAFTHQQTGTVVDLHRQLVAREPEDTVLAWRLDGLLYHLDRHPERAALQLGLARKEADPARRRTALLDAARLHEEAGDDDTAIDLYRELLAASPRDPYLLDAFIDRLRARARWDELASVRGAEARAASNDASARRAYREAAWVVEVRLNDPTRAVELYAEWSKRLPGDRAALEGLARCAMRLADHAREATTRAAISAIELAPETHWLYAHSLERAGRLDEAAEQYRVVAGDTPSVATVGAVLALAELAARGPVTQRADAIAALAASTSHAQLAATLFEESGWIHLFALGDVDRASQAFASALERNPGRRSAWLGVALVGAKGSESHLLGTAHAKLGATPSPELAAALLLRASAYAAANDDLVRAGQLVGAASAAAPDHPDVLVIATEVDSPATIVASNDPFAAVEALITRAELVARRAALVDDPASRATWELDRAELLERAGQAEEAASAVATALQLKPDDRRAVTVLRRIAHGAGDKLTWASTCYALARDTRDPITKLGLLREAAGVYDAPETRNQAFAMTTMRRIAELDPAGPESDRLLELIRSNGDARALIAALTERLNRLSPENKRVAPLLFERATALHEIGRRGEAVADVDAVLLYMPDHLAALRLGATMAGEANDLGRAASLWKRAHAIEPDAESKLALEQLLGKAVDDAAFDETTGTWTNADSDFTDAEMVLPPSLADSVTAEVTRERRASKPDLFGGPTPPADLRTLQEQERKVARKPPPPPPKRGGTATNPVDPITTPVRIGIPKLEIARLLMPTGPDSTAVAFEVEPIVDCSAIQFPDADAFADSAEVLVSYDRLQPARSEVSEDMLHAIEREVELVKDPAIAVAVRLEAGRLCEALDHHDRAREHYECALLENPRETAALRGLRRIARRANNLVELARLLDVELAVADPRERAPLARYRIDVLLACREVDLARVAVGELLDRNPNDLAGLLAHLELVLIDLRPDERAEIDELASTLERLAAIPDPELRGAVSCARAMLALRDGADPTLWFTQAVESDPTALAAQLALLRRRAGNRHAEAGVGMLELACHVESDDQVMAAAMAMRAATWAAAAGDHQTSLGAAQVAARAAPRDVLAARFAAETALTAGDPATATHAFSRWARCKTSATERAYAAARAAELDPERLARLWAQVLELDGDDDYAAGQLRAEHRATEHHDDAIELDLQRARETGREVPLVRATAELIAAGRIDAALDLLVQAREAGGSVIVGEALARALTRAGRWDECARLLADLATRPGLMASDVLRLRAALARDRVARTSEPALVIALDAWDLVLVDDPHAPVAHAGAIALASRLDDPGPLMEALARARAVERSPWAAASLALRHARLLLRGDPRLAEEILRDAAPSFDDPRCALGLLLAAAQRGELGDAVSALAARAATLETAGAESRLEPAMLRIRAACLAIRGGAFARARSLIARVEEAIPKLVPDLVDIGEHTETPATADHLWGSFTRLIHDADLAAARGDIASALVGYRFALDLRPSDPLAAEPLLRTALKLRETSLLASIAVERLRSAIALGDGAAQADAYEQLARVDQVRGDASAANSALHRAWLADGSRIDLLLQLERGLSGIDLLRLRDHRIADLRRDDGPRDLIALLADTATLKQRANRPAEELASIYRAILELDPRNRFAAFRLEAFLRAAGPSDDLAVLRERIAQHAGDPRAAAAWFTRAGETLASLGKPRPAVALFTKATEAVVGYSEALDRWYETALAAKLWSELAAAATLKQQHHFAGVVLMDKVRAPEPAIVALRHALQTHPNQLDSFVRLRVLLDEAGYHEELEAMLRNRLAGEQDRASQAELHRFLAEHFRMRGDRDLSRAQYRAMLAIDPADARAHAAITDLISDADDWREAAALVSARIPLERDVITLRSLCLRLGAICADHDRPAALRAFQQALTYKPDDERVLLALADLAVEASEWQIALDACDRLVSSDRSPTELAGILRRASTIFERGFGNKERAERMLLLALESAPTSTEGLRLLVQLYKTHDDKVSLRSQLERISSRMRTRVEEHPDDGSAYRMFALAAAARAEHLQDRTLPLAHTAAELAKMLGAADDLSKLAEPDAPSLAMLAGAQAEELLFAGAREPQLRALFRLFAEPIARLVGVENVARKDRVRPTDQVASIAREVATALGFRAVDVYVTSRMPLAMYADTTSPTTLILGNALVTDATRIRFAATAALSLARLDLGVPARLSVDELAGIALAIVSLVDPNAHIGDEPVRLEALRRITPMTVIDTARLLKPILPFDAANFRRDLRIAALRAGVVGSGRVAPGLHVLRAASGSELATVLADPVSRGLVAFALDEQRIR